MNQCVFFLSSWEACSWHIASKEYVGSLLVSLPLHSSPKHLYKADCGVCARAHVQIFADMHCKGVLS